MRLAAVGIYEHRHAARAFLTAPLLAVWAGVCDGVHHAPSHTHTHLGRFFKLDCPTTKRVPCTERCTPSESSRRYVSSALPFIFGNDGTIPTVEMSSMEKSAEGCVVHVTVVCGNPPFRRLSPGCLVRSMVLHPFRPALLFWGHITWNQRQICVDVHSTTVVKGLA